MSHLENVGQYDYDKTKVLGHGAFAVVYKGFNTSSPSQCVAVKCISKKQNAKSKVLSAEEIKILKEVQHQNVVQFLDFKETDTHMYMVMEFCNGGDLAEYLRDKGAMVESTLQLFVKQMAQALLAIHEKGVMHRDLKPGNILLCHNSALSVIQPRDIKLKIADFGFARFLNEEDMAATLCGSPIYMAPEVLMGLQYDARVDLWSLGTIIYQCYTGKAPFKANNPYHLRTFYEKSPTLQPMIPQSCSLELKDLILQLLQKNPDNRITFENLVKHKFLEIETELPGEKTPPYATPPQSQPIPVQSNFDRSSPKVSPGQSPGSSPSRWGSRSPSNSSTKLALMQKMRRSPREPMTPRNPVLIESTKSSAGNSITETISESPDTEGFVLVDRTNRTRPKSLDPYESQFLQKSTAITTSTRTPRAMPIDIKSRSTSPDTSTMNIRDIPQQGSVASGAPHLSMSPIAQRMAMEGQDTAPPLNFNRGSPRRMSGGMRNASAPNFDTIKRQLSFESRAGNRPRFTSESQAETPTKMEIVSRSVRHSPNRRPFSAQFDDSFRHDSYAPKAMSGVSSSGTSAPPYFFIGQSPQSGTPPQPQSPLQLTFGETSPSVQSFALPPELTEITIMDEDQRELLDQFQASLRYCQAIREAAHLIENPFAVTDFKDKTKLGEKLVVCLKAESILSNTIHTAKQQLFAHNLSPSKTFKDVLYSVYGEFCAVHEMKLLLEKEVVLTDIACAEEILLGFALQQIRSGILDENFGHVKECLKRYRLSLALIIGLSTDVTSDHDRASLSRFESGLRHRLKTLTRQDFQWS